MDASEFHTSSPKKLLPESLFHATEVFNLFRFSNHGKYFLKKSINQKHVFNTRYRETLKNEFEIGIQLDHPNINKYIDFINDGDNYHLVMDYVDGQNLKEFQNGRNTFTEYQVFLKHINQIIDVLSYLHAKQIYHLDLKPENLVVTHRGKNIKVIDFGFACSDSSISSIGRTKKYSPEDSDKNLFGPDSDIYSFGILLNEYIKLIDMPKKLMNKWAQIIAKCKSQSYSNVVEIQNEIRIIDIGESKNSKLYLLVLLTIVVLLFTIFYFITTKPSPSETSVSDVKSTESSNNNTVNEVNPTLTQTNVNAINKFQTEDSILLSGYGKLLLQKFNDSYSKSTGNPKRALEIQGKLTDSIQSLWVNYSKKFPVTSKEYQRAYYIYTNSINEAQKQIMLDAFK